MAAQRRGPVKVLVQPENGSLDAIATADRSSLSVGTWNSVTASLHFDDRRDGVLVDKQVVEAPLLAAAKSGRDANLAADQQPAARRCGVDLCARQKRGMIGEQLLKQLLGGIGFGLHLDHVAILVDKEDPVAARHR